VNSYIKINREVDKEITNIPRFIVDVSYEGCRIEYDDIYFDNLDELWQKIEKLEKSRKGKVTLDGGTRFRLNLCATKQGGIKIEVTAEKFNLPGRISLEGILDVEGEFVSRLIGLFKALLLEGRQLEIKATDGKCYFVC
jgi:hypothetical protein